MEILKPFKWTQVVWILKLICIILLPSGLWAESGPVKVIQLEFVKTLPHANEEKVFFKMIPHIALDNDGNIFAIQNGYHFVFKMDPKGKFVSRIGRKGQGPGELYRPFRIEIFENKLFVKDRTGISIFQVDGAYQERFRLFSPFIAMAPWQNKIAVAEATLTAWLPNTITPEKKPIPSASNINPIIRHLKPGHLSHWTIPSTTVNYFFTRIRSILFPNYLERFLNTPSTAN